MRSARRRSTRGEGQPPVVEHGCNRHPFAPHDYTPEPKHTQANAHANRSTLKLTQLKY